MTYINSDLCCTF